MEHLTKSQIVLLTLFVSFVSSMATGIVTVTLMQQAPEPVAQSITNVVERTIEKITPTIVEKPGKTVVLKDEDLIVAAIAQNTKSIVPLRVAGDGGEVYSAGLGIIVSDDGLVVTEKTNFLNGSLTTSLGGVTYTVPKVFSPEGSALALGKLTPTASSTQSASFTPASLSDDSTLKIGQTAIVIAGKEGKTITKGLVNDIITKVLDLKDPKASPVITNIALSERFGVASNGAPIITLDGAVAGILGVHDDSGVQVGIPALDAQKLMRDYQESLKAASAKK